MSVFNETFRESQGFFNLCNNGNSVNEQPKTQPQRQQQEVHVAPEDKRDKEELDALLSQAMSSLTFQERLEQQERVHGVDQVIEDDAFIDRALQDLQTYLLHNAIGSAYEVAEQRDPNYVHNRAFRIMFLRANKYNAKATGDQMIRHFNLKFQLFGEEKLNKDITMSDLDEDDIACIKAGATQLAGRDTSGRQVFVTVARLMDPSQSKSIENMVRAIFYTVMKTLRSEETQLRGTVGIWYAVGDWKNETQNRGAISKYWYELFKTGKYFPNKRQAIHLCVDEIHQAILCNALLKIMPSNMRARLKLHYGSPTECQYQLATYGILPESWPVDSNGRMKIERHLHWVHRCAREDNVLSQSPLDKRWKHHGDDPGPNDVLFTRGNIRNHEGTVSFRNIVEEYSTLYDSGTYVSKREVVDEIIERIHETGGRFLAETGDASTLWEELPSDKARKKIMQTFRNRRRRRDASKQATGCGVGTLIVGNPLPNDVVFGTKLRTAGSDLLQRLMKDHFEEYESLERGTKGKLVDTIIRDILEQGGRFLQPAEEPGKWLKLSIDSARERISKSFRNQRRYLST